MVRRKQRDSSACPWCDAENEHLVHILSCPQQSAKETTQSLRTELEHWLIQEDTHPQLTAALLHTITHWFHDPYDDDMILCFRNLFLSLGATFLFILLPR